MTDRVVVLGPGLHEVGGMAKRTRLLAEGLADRGWFVFHLGRTASGRTFSVRRRERIVSIEFPGFDLPWLGAVVYLLLATPLAVFLSVTSRCLLTIQLKSPATVAGIASLLTTRPFVCMTTTSGDLSEIAYISGGRTSPIRRRLLSRASLFITQTSQGRDEILASDLASCGVIVLPTPVEQIDAPPALAGTPTALFSGRFSEEKDLPRLLEAWRGVVQSVPDAQLTLLGTGGGFRSVEDLIRHQVVEDPVLRRSVRFAGWVRDVGLHLVDSDLYVFPSRSEGMSNSLLEACAYGRVVVASDIEANVSVLGREYPLFFRTGDTTSLQEAVLRAFGDPQLREEARRKALSSASRASAASVVRRLDRVLRDVAHRTPDQHSDRDRGS